GVHHEVALVLGQPRAVLSEVAEPDHLRLDAEDLAVEAESLRRLASEVQVRVDTLHELPPAASTGLAPASRDGAEACAASQAGSEASSWAIPAAVRSRSRSRASSVDCDVTQPFSSRSSALRDRVVRSRPRTSASRVTVAPPVLARAARIENCVDLSPVGRRYSSKWRVSRRAVFLADRHRQP